MLSPCTVILFIYSLLSLIIAFESPLHIPSLVVCLVQERTSIFLMSRSVTWKGKEVKRILTFLQFVCVQLPRKLWNLRLQLFH